MTEEGQITDRYTRAIEQLGSENLDVRLGAVYALERIARDSGRDQPTVMEVLTAFIRRHSLAPWPEPGTKKPGVGAPDRATRPDVQAAITVIGRRDTRRDMQLIDLTRADLTGADLTAANLAGANLTGAILRAANLTRANLTGTNLTDADLTDADLTDAGLMGAMFADGQPVPMPWVRDPESGRIRYIRISP